MFDYDVTAFVVDNINSSGMCKVGFAGEDALRTVFSPNVGSPCHYGWYGTKSMHDVGDEAQGKCDILNLHYSIEQGI